MTTPQSITAPVIRATGLLGTFDIIDDWWMVTCFVALRSIIDVPPERSSWMVGQQIRLKDRQFLLGDPDADRIVFDDPSFEGVYLLSPAQLLHNFLLQLRDVASKSFLADTIVIVLCGHGEEDGSFRIGHASNPVYMFPQDIIDALEQADCKVILISEACFSGSWSNERWTLLAAASATDVSVSIVVSESGEYRGGIFTSSLVAHRAHEFNVRAPCPATFDLQTEQRGDQQPHDFGKNSQVISKLTQPLSTVPAMLEWMRSWKDNIGRTYTATDFTFNALDPNIEHDLPFVPLSVKPGSLHRHLCVGPSRPNGVDVSREGGQPKKGATIYRYASSTKRDVPLATEVAIPLSPEESLELSRLASHLNKNRPRPVPANSWVVLASMKYVKGIDIGPRLHELLQYLRDREHQRDRAKQIATILGWQKAIKAVGDDWEDNGNTKKFADAENHRCLVRQLFLHTHEHWWEAGTWLWRVWEAMGKPEVSKEQWETADHCQCAPRNGKSLQPVCRLE